MHEWSICQHMVNAAQDELKKLSRPGARLLCMRVKIGDLHAIVDENLRMAYQALTEHTPLAGSVLELIHIPIEARCKTCGKTCGVQNSFFVCAHCGSVSLEVVSGRELFIENLEVSYDE
jgi:hydrogenase nickel incorporation protein HypA/HybF